MAEHSERKKHRFARRMRLVHARQFRAVHGGQRRRSAGPLLVYAIPNGLDHLRLGLSVSRRVGRAVRRNRIKRMVREALRLMQHELPGGYDLLVSVRPHEPLALEEYERMLAESVNRLDRTWQKRRTKNERS